MCWPLSIIHLLRILAPLWLFTECMKKGGFFEWTKADQRAFQSIKKRLCLACILGLPNFELQFEIECEVSRVGIRSILTQSKRRLAYLSEKLNGSRLNYSTYDKELYTIVKASEHWNHYLKPKPFVLHLDHKALFCISGQHKLNMRHTK